MRLLISLVCLMAGNVVFAACPTNFSPDGSRWFTSDPEWSSDVVYLVTTFSVSNDMGSDISFTSGGIAVSDADTIQRWVPQPVGADPYLNPAYDIPDANLIFKLSPAGETFAAGETVSWEVAVDISSAPATWQKRLSIRPEGATPGYQFAHTLLSSEIICSTGEPFFAEILEAEAGLGEILLTVSAEQGSAAITDYEAVCADSSGASTSVSSASTSITVTDLEGGEDYTCTVTATNSIGTSVASDPTETLTPTSGGLPVWLLHEASTP